MKSTKALTVRVIGLVCTALFTILGCQGRDEAPEKQLHLSANGIETRDHGYMRKNLTALELADLMGNGINLGNTMEAYGRAELGLDADVSSYETFWGQPVTTQEMITGMKEAGFDSLRIPVAWTNTMDYESGDYTIREEYLDRVEEIINYALNEDMYVIVNDHWDGGWWGMFGSASPETRKAGMDLYVSMWTQIAQRYKEYSDYLIFESANEELGDRLNETHVVPDSNTLSKDETYQVTNLINQTFVDTIRGTGGNNAKRFLLIAGYNTDIRHTSNNRFMMPKDTEKNRLLLSVHYYTPWGFTGGPSVSRWGTEREYQQQNDLLSMLTQFTDEGYGVVIGEYMVAPAADGSIKPSALDFLNNFHDNCDLYGYVPMLWDHSMFFIRKDHEFFDNEISEFYISRSNTTRAQKNMSAEEIKTAAQTNMAAALVAAAAADKAAVESGEVEKVDADSAKAWIMFNSQDWNITYSVGDLYDPQSKTDGLVATDAQVTGPGTYTVGLDFTGTGTGFAASTAFSALAIFNGELLYPGYIITITDLQINGKSYQLIAEPFTTTDDKRTTRVNLYNGWVDKVPPEARTADGDTSDVSAVILDNQAPELQRIETLTITFDYGPAQ